MVAGNGSMFLACDDVDSADSMDGADEEVSSLQNGSWRDDIWVQERESLRPEYRVAISAVVIVLIVFTTFGNLLTIIAVRLDKRLRSISNFYIASLAFADLLVGSFVMTFMLLYTVTFDGAWVFGIVFCDVWTFVDYVSCTASLTNVCLVAADRYQTVASPLKAIRKRTRRRAKYLIAAAWLVPIIFWLTMITLLRVLNGRPPPGSCHLIWRPKLIVLFSAAAIVYLPITTILSLFVAMMCVLRGHMTNMTERMRRSNSFRRENPSCSQYSEDTTSLRSGGISFNPRFSVDISLYALEKKGDKLQLRTRSSSTLEADKTDTSIQEVWLYSSGSEQCPRGAGETKCRSVGTSTSPERYGLVRTVATNTSPTLARKTSVKYIEENHDTKVELEFSSKSTITRASFHRDPSLATETDTESETDTAERTTSSLSPSRDSRFSVSESTPKKWRRYASLLRAERHSSMERSRLIQQLRAAKTLGLIMGFLLLCWLPFSIMWPVTVFCPHCISQRSYDITFWTNYLNSSINPVLYCLCNQNFRKAFKRLLSRH